MNNAEKKSEYITIKMVQKIKKKIIFIFTFTLLNTGKLNAYTNRYPSNEYFPWKCASRIHNKQTRDRTHIPTICDSSIKILLINWNKGSSSYSINYNDNIIVMIIIIIIIINK